MEILEKGDEESDARNAESYIRTMRKQKGSQRVVVERGLEQGDVAILDFQFLRPDNREDLPHLKQEKFRFDTDLPDALGTPRICEVSLHPGCAGVTDRVTGIRVGDVREFDITFPQDWEPPVYRFVHPAQQWLSSIHASCRGVEAIAVVTCRELFAWDLPELTDGLVKALDRPTLQTVDDLRSSLILAERSRRAERLQDAIQDALLHELAAIVDMEIPEAALMETAKVRYQTMLLEMQSKVRSEYSSNRSGPRHG